MIFRNILVGSVLLLISSNAYAADKNLTPDGADYWKIVELSSKYAWGIDTLDKEMLGNVFTEDATAHYRIVNDSPIKLDKTLSGFSSIYGWLKDSLGHRKGIEGFPWHFVSNQIVEINGNEGMLRFYMHNRPGIAGGVYYMKVTKTDKGWRVKDLRLDEQIWNASGYDSQDVTASPSGSR